MKKSNVLKPNANLKANIKDNVKDKIIDYLNVNMSDCIKE